MMTLVTIFMCDKIPLFMNIFLFFGLEITLSILSKLIKLRWYFQDKNSLKKIALSREKVPEIC